MHALVGVLIVLVRAPIETPWRTNSCDELTRYMANMKLRRYCFDSASNIPLSLYQTSTEFQ